MRQENGDYWIGWDRIMEIIGLDGIGASGWDGIIFEGIYAWRICSNQKTF